MNNQIIRYPVRHPLLKKYIKFFWELRIEHIQLNHKLIPQRNINMRFNLSDTAHNACIGNKESSLEDVYFLGLHSKFTDTHLKLNGKVDVLGVCFEPDGLYPFVKIPVSEFKNQILGADEIGFKIAKRISERLKEAADITNRLTILENELVSLLDLDCQIPENLRLILKALKQENSLPITEFCQQNNVSLRQMERMYVKYIGLSASTFTTLDRFHSSLNQLLNTSYSKLSDLAYDNGYFDQMHLIKEFKRYTGITPRDFINQSNSILQIGKLT